MSKKTLLILWAIALVLLGSVAILKLTDSEAVVVQPTDRNPGDFLLENFQAEEVEKIAVTSESGTLTLKRKDQSWTVAERADYPADYTSVAGLLRNLTDLKISQSLRAGEAYNSRFGIGTGEGMTVTFSSPSGDRVLHVGKEPVSTHARTLRSETRFVKTPDTPNDVYIVPGQFAGFEPNPADWLAGDFIRLEKIRSIETPNWSVSRANESSDLTGENQTLQKAASIQLTNFLSIPQFEDIALEPAPGDKTTVTVTTFDNFTYTLSYWPVPSSSSFYFTVSVNADIPSSRSPKPGESPEQAQAIQAAFESSKKRLSEKLSQEKAFEQHTYILSADHLAPVISAASDIFATSAPASVTTPPVRGQ